MPKYSFGARSKAHYDTLDERLQRVLSRALGYGCMDFSIIDGVRTIEDQRRYVAEGKSRTMNSRHLPNDKGVSEAVDVLPYPHAVNGVDVWQDSQRFAVLAGLIMSAACEEGVKIRWGGDWDGDGNNKDARLHDMPHFELVV